MTRAVLSPSGSSHRRVLGAIGAAHFVSHYYILLLAPLLPFVRADYGVSYTEISFALVAFNVISAALQTPAGFLVDRFGGRVLLVTGLIVGAAAFLLAGLIDSFWFMVAMFALAGVGNTVYHPADYALMSQHTPQQRIGQAFSVHTFAGMLGSAVAPPALLLMHELWGWRTAFVVSGLFGLVTAGIVAAMPESPAATLKRVDAVNENGKPDWHVLFSAPILLNLFFFVLLAMMTAGLYNYSVVALNGLYGTPMTIANAGLTGFLLTSSAGVLLGGMLVGRTNRHGFVATVCLIVTAAFVLLVGLVDLRSLGLVGALSVAGLFSGAMMPSRDMIVRAVTPPGSFGKVFGFVTTGFNLGGIVAPLIFGPIMDHGSPRLVFLVVAALCLISTVTVVGRMRG